MLSFNFTPFPVLTTERLVLRELRESDFPDWYITRIDERVLRYINKEPAKNEEEAMKVMRLIMQNTLNNEGITWAITYKDQDLLLGTVCLWNLKPEHHRAEIGYSLLPDNHNKRVMSEAIKPVLDYGLSSMKLHTIEANVNPDNVASIKLLEHNGFVREGYFKEDFYFRGQFLDSAVYSLLAPG